MTNCVNCGAPINHSRYKCEYCDSPYVYDLVDATILYADDKPLFSIDYNRYKHLMDVNEQLKDTKDAYDKAINAMRAFSGNLF